MTRPQGSCQAARRTLPLSLAPAGKSTKKQPITDKISLTGPVRRQGSLKSNYLQGQHLIALYTSS